MAEAAGGNSRSSRSCLTGLSLTVRLDGNDDDDDEEDEDDESEEEELLAAPSPASPAVARQRTGSRIASSPLVAKLSADWREAKPPLPTPPDAWDETAFQAMGAVLVRSLRKKLRGKLPCAGGLHLGGSGGASDGSLPLP